MNNRILMRIDFQNDFVQPHGKLTLNCLELIERHRHFADSLFSDSFAQIIETYDTHFVETYNHTGESKLFPPHCILGSIGWQQAVPFRPELNAVKLYKSTTNIWNEEKVYTILAQNWLNKEVYLCGVLSDVCVKQAMNGLLKRGATVIVLEDLCLGAKKQICDVLAETAYRPFIERGQLKSRTSAQFFRRILSDRKIQHNLVTKSRGE